MAASPCGDLEYVRKDKQERFDRLVAVIEQQVQNEPVEFEDQVWANAPEPMWADLADISLATLKRYIKLPPIRRTWTHIDGAKVVLLRVGEPAPLKPREIANLMKSIFHKILKFEVQQTNYGILKGLAQKWPQGHQLEIFKLVLNNWPAFKAGVAIEIGMLIDAGRPGKFTWHEFPSVSVMLRFQSVAVELYIMDLQEKGIFPPAEVMNWTEEPYSG